MAIYGFEFKTITRHKGLSAHAHARYIARSAHNREPTLVTDTGRAAGRHAGYLERIAGQSSTARADLEHAEHRNMPTWAQAQPQEFWRAADIFERANGRLYSEMMVSLPRELNQDQRLALVREFVEQEIGDRHPVTFAMHNPKALDGGDQPHVHIMFTKRRLDGIARDREQFFRRYNGQHPECGGAAKDRSWIHVDRLKALRHNWAEMANRHLERAGLEMRIDHRSLAAQGIDRAPEPKMGKDRTAMLQQGKMTDLTAEVMQLRKDRGSLVLSGASNSFNHKQISNIQTSLNGCVGTNGSGSECHNTAA